MSSSEIKSDLIKQVIDLFSTPTFTNESSISGNIQKVLSLLQQIYTPEYRHSYADIFSILQPILDMDPEAGDTIGENLSIIECKLDKVIEDNPEDESIKHERKSFDKLADHIRLEVARYTATTKRLAKLEATSKKPASPEVSALNDRIKRLDDDFEITRSMVTDTKKTLDIAQKTIDGIDPKLENSKVSSITALTVFSAVVLAFSGGISFESSALSSLSTSSPYRLVFMITLTGFVLFNTIFILLYTVGKMIDKRVGTSCRHLIEKNAEMQKVNSCKQCGRGTCSQRYSRVTFLCRAIHKYAYALVVNVILLWMMYSDFLLWKWRIATTIGVWNIVLIIAPVILMLFYFLLRVISRKFQKSLQVKHLLVYLLEGYLAPEQASSSLSHLLTATAQAMSKVLGNLQPTSKTLSESFQDEMRLCDFLNDGKSAKKRILLFAENEVEKSQNATVWIRFETALRDQRNYKMMLKQLKNARRKR